MKNLNSTQLLVRRIYSVRMFIILTLFLIFDELGGHLAYANIDYCDRKMCPHQGKHVACGKTKDFDPSCKGYPKLVSLKQYQPLILHEHNKYRSLVAAGKVKCFYPAKRMPVLYWNDDLAETAEYNVKSCVFAHDQCRSTRQFPMAGQNIYMTKTKHTNISTENFIKEAIFMWFEEQYNANHTVMASFRKTVPQTGHFTLMASDRQNCTGCAFLEDFLPADPAIEKDKDRLFIIFTCNYSSTNIRNLPSYKAGPAASDCKQKSSKYEALCEDPIDSNDLTWYKKP